VLHYARLERLAKDQQSSLLGSFVGYEENVVQSPLEPILQNFFRRNLRH
jgi:hypothetical protein